VGSDPFRTHDELLAEIDTLRRENARLRSVLGLDGRAGNGHEASWAPTLLTLSSPAAPVDTSAPLSAKVDLLKSLFGARSDVYAVRWQSASSGKSGWQPATKGGWSKRRSPRDFLVDRRRVRGPRLRAALPGVAILSALSGGHG
jgi:hypothetical protein